MQYGSVLGGGWWSQDDGGGGALTCRVPVRHVADGLAVQLGDLGGAPHDTGSTGGGTHGCRNRAKLLIANVVIIDENRAVLAFVLSDRPIFHEQRLMPRSGRFYF